jgi:hypothetical protein
MGSRMGRFPIVKFVSLVANGHWGIGSVVHSRRELRNAAAKLFAVFCLFLAAEVLATAGNETGWGGGFASIGNYFGLHGNGPAGTYLSASNGTPVQMFSGPDTFMASGQEFVNNISPNLGGDMSQEPFVFFTILNQNGYATGNPNYASDMTQEGAVRGPYTLVMACMGAG